ncbi:MAG: PhoH family protein [Bacteroidia bacterium]|nr:PhoH family protein [Bacteroidia bacterium]
MAKKVTPKGTKKIFVLDTSVILHDHNSLHSFAEHDVAIPITVLEEVDKFKKGNETINYVAREFVRELDKLSKEINLQQWNWINDQKKGQFKVIMNERGSVDADRVFGERKNDHHILNAALKLAEENPDKHVTLVTKDINLRLKARALNLTAEDFETGIVHNIDELYKGYSNIEIKNKTIIDKLYNEGITPKELGVENPKPNHYYSIRSNESTALGYYNADTQLIEKVIKETAYGIRPRNAEQTFALHAILNPEVKLVTIQGVAGTGKTLLALAGALMQRENFRQIYLARPIVPLSNKDIGYLPGDIKSKINPYMEPLWDNLKLIQSQFKETDKDYQKITDMVEKEKLFITPLAYIRGRSLSNIIFIIDEAQNLTPHEIKTIITRAGENTKIIFTGDIYQIDTPYLDSHSNGLSTLIEKIKNSKMYAHVSLEKGERSELANLASNML